MLSMETCVSPDGSTVSYYHDKVSCASMGLKEYHWQVEPFHRYWMWMQTPAGAIVTMMVICVGLIAVLDAKQRYGRAEQDADHTTA